MKTFKGSLFTLALLSFGVVACDGTDADPTNAQPGREEITVPAATAEPADVTPFLGVWAYSSGSATSTCGSDIGTTQISAANGALEITTGTKPGTVAVKDGACAFSANVSGSDAIAEPGTKCEGFLGTLSIVYSVSGRTMHKQAFADGTAAKFGVVCSKKEDATLIGR